MSYSSINLLILEDNPEESESLVRLLNSFDGGEYKIIIKTANSVLDALHIRQTYRIDAAFLDYSLDGGMFGDELIDRVDDPFGSMFVVLISGKPEDSIKEAVIYRHRQIATRIRYLPKPLKMMELQAVYISIVNHIKNRPMPYPLAYPIKKVEHYETSCGKILAMKDYVENLLKYIISICITDAHAKNEHQLLKLRLQRPITLGIIVRWFSELLAYYKKNGDNSFIPELMNVTDQLMPDGRRYLSR